MAQKGENLSMYLSQEAIQYIEENKGWLSKSKFIDKTLIEARDKKNENNESSKKQTGAEQAIESYQKKRSNNKIS